MALFEKLEQRISEKEAKAAKAAEKLGDRLEKNERASKSKSKAGKNARARGRSKK